MILGPRVDLRFAEALGEGEHCGGFQHLISDRDNRMAIDCRFDRGKGFLVDAGRDIEAFDRRADSGRSVHGLQIKNGMRGGLIAHGTLRLSSAGFLRKE